MQEAGLSAANRNSVGVLPCKALLTCEGELHLENTKTLETKTTNMEMLAYQE